MTMTAPCAAMPFCPSAEASFVSLTYRPLGPEDARRARFRRSYKLNYQRLKHKQHERFQAPRYRHQYEEVGSNHKHAKGAFLSDFLPASFLVPCVPSQPAKPLKIKEPTFYEVEEGSSEALERDKFLFRVAESASKVLSRKDIGAPRRARFVDLVTLTLGEEVEVLAYEEIRTTPLGDDILSHEHYVSVRKFSNGVVELHRLEWSFSIFYYSSKLSRNPNKTLVFLV